MIGLIFGETDFPKQILKKVKKRKKYLIIDLTKTKRFSKDKNSYSVSIGQFGRIISILKENNCNKILFAGKVNKPNFSTLKLDFKGIYYIPRIIKSSKIGDAAILKEIIKILKKETVDMLFVTASENIAWLLNLRGHDSEFSPIPNGYLIIDKESNVIFFCDLKKINNKIRKYFKKIKILDIKYVDLFLFKVVTWTVLNKK